MGYDDSVLGNLDVVIGTKTNINDFMSQGSISKQPGSTS